jgi:hypothetical protein
MKHVYPVRHPPMPQDTARGETTASRDSAREPALPHEHDESSHGQASATPQQGVVGRKTHGNATDGTTDTDRGPVREEVRNDKPESKRGRAEPRR